VKDEAHFLTLSVRAAEDHITETHAGTVGIDDRDRVWLVGGLGEGRYVGQLLWGASGGIARGPVEGRVVIMGMAIVGMHYTGMYALKLEPTKEVITNTGIALSPQNLAYSVFGVTAVILTLLLGYSAWKAQRRLSADL